MRRLLGLLMLLLVAGAGSAAAAVPALQEPPYWAKDIKKGKLPPIQERLPENPAIAAFDWPGQVPGQYGGELTTLFSGPKDTRYIVTYGYAQLVTYDSHYNLVPNILESFEVQEGRIFTFHLRKGHKWSDGSPFTSEDFRFYWEDVANNAELSPGGPPAEFLVQGEMPQVEVLDKTTVRYTWSKPNPEFLADLALEPNFFIYMPSKYLKKLHKKYADAKELDAAVKDAGARNWAANFNRRANQYSSGNPKLPTLGPWVLKTKPPAERFIFERNPYYFRIDPEGRQLPYIDKVIGSVADGKLIPAKTGAGESMLQARNIRFTDYTFLKQSEASGNYRVLLWTMGTGSSFALFPDLTAKDKVWRKVLRDLRFRRALSLGIDRHEINQVIYFGLAREGGNTVLAESPLFSPKYQHAYADFDPKEANRLLNEMGLTGRDGEGFRLLPDGRPLTIIVEITNQVPEAADVLELIRDSWAQIGVRLFTKPFELDVWRRRVFAGNTIMSAWTGLENGLATADSSPAELAPVSQQGYEWSRWGEYHESRGKSGEVPDMPEAQQLLNLLSDWDGAADSAGRAEIWGKMLSIFADQVFTIGTVAAVPQPVVVSKRLHNLPQEAIWSFNPGNFFGIYRPDLFWLDPAP